MNATATTISASQFQAQQNRKVWLKNKRGDVVGGNFTIPKGDFAHFLGFKAETQQEKQGNISGQRTVEVAVRKQMQELGSGAMERGMQYRNNYIAWNRLANKPNRDSKDIINSGIDSIKNSVEMGHASGIRYLEMQYKFHMASKSFGTISNIMKTRHESVKKAVNEVR